MIEHLTDEELIHYADNKDDATPLERELANRLDAVLKKPKNLPDQRGQQELPL